MHHQKGTVNIVSPESKVCYESSPTLTCTSELESDQSSWYMTKLNKTFELSNGSVVRLNRSCATTEYKSCVAVTLNKVTGDWAGK